MDYDESLPSYQQKQTQDLSEEVTTLLAQLPAPSPSLTSSSISDCINRIFALEKRTRNFNDPSSTTSLLIRLVEYIVPSQNADIVESTLSMALKKRSQFKSAAVAMIDKAIELTTSQLSNSLLAIPLLKAIRNVTEGKLFLEVERARTTKMLASLLFDSGDKQTAMEYMLELPVETFGSMSRQEKTRLLLDQLKLSLSNADLMKAGIILKKISVKSFDEDEAVREMKGEFYDLKKTLDILNRSWIDVVGDYLVLSENECSDSQKYVFLNSAAFYCILSPFDCIQQDQMQRLRKDKHIQENCPETVQLLELFLSKELVPLNEFTKRFGKCLIHNDCIFGENIPFDSNGSNHSSSQTNLIINANNALYSCTSQEACLLRWNLFCNRLIEHNLRIVSSFFSQITMQRLSQLVQVPQEKVEQVLAGLIIDKVIYARINRPAGIVSFQKKYTAEERLDVWSAKVRDVLELIVSTSHLVAKEEMLSKN